MQALLDLRKILAEHTTKIAASKQRRKYARLSQAIVTEAKDDLMSLFDEVVNENNEVCSDDGDGDAKEDDEMEPPIGTLPGMHHKRRHACAVSTSQLNISDEFALVHMAMPSNGVVR